MKKAYKTRKGKNNFILALGFAIVALFVLGYVLYNQTSLLHSSADSAVGQVDAANTNNGFDGYGYNYKARMFQGTADGVDRIIDGKVWGDTTYANDHLVMKWSKAWDDARFHGKAWTPDAWVDNEWNGKLPDGSDVTEHAKIIWVGSDLENSKYWKTGGYPIWGEFEVVMDQGMTGTTHYWAAHAIPNGLGSN